MTSWVLPVSFVPVLLAVIAAFSIRWRRRALFVALLVVGAVLAVGAHPFDDPSPFGRLFKAVLEDVGPARAMRSITRVTRRWSCSLSPSSSAQASPRRFVVRSDGARSVHSSRS